MNDDCWNHVLKLFRRAIICPQCKGKDVDYLGCYLEGKFVTFRCNNKKCRHDYYPATKNPAEIMAIRIRLLGVRSICGKCDGSWSLCHILKDISSNIKLEKCERINKRV